MIPDAAVREVEGRDHSDISAKALFAATWIKRIQVDFVPFEITKLGLGDGESAVLALALANPGYGAIFDDQAARTAAASLGIPQLGTLGVVVSAKIQGLIPSAKVIIEQLRQNGMYLSNKLIALTLARVGE